MHSVGIKYADYAANKISDSI